MSCSVRIPQPLFSVLNTCKTTFVVMLKFFKRTKERLMMFLPVTLPSVDVEQLYLDKFWNICNFCCTHKCRWPQFHSAAWTDNQHPCGFCSPDHIVCSESSTASKHTWTIGHFNHRNWDKYQTEDFTRDCSGSILRRQDNPDQSNLSFFRQSSVQSQLVRNSWSVFRFTSCFDIQWLKSRQFI